MIILRPLRTSSLWSLCRHLSFYQCLRKIIHWIIIIRPSKNFSHHLHRQHHHHRHHHRHCSPWPNGPSKYLNNGDIKVKLHVNGPKNCYIFQSLFLLPPTHVYGPAWVGARFSCKVSHFWCGICVICASHSSMGKNMFR